MPILKRGDLFFPLKATKGRNDLGEGDTGKAEFCRLIAPRQHKLASLFTDIAFGKSGGVKKYPHQDAVSRSSRMTLLSDTPSITKGCATRRFQEGRSCGSGTMSAMGLPLRTILTDSPDSTK